MHLCRVCGSPSLAASFTAREMMFGFRDTFPYAECGDCRSVQIEHIPDADVLNKYYPADYYSFSAPRHLSVPARAKAAVRQAAARFISRNALTSDSAIGSLLLRRIHSLAILELFKRAKIGINARILDVGTGSGSLLDDLSRFGFKNLLGVDPYLASDTASATGVQVLKRTLDAVSGKFDVIMFHHSLEHVPDPSATLKLAFAKLSQNGVCLVRIPTTTSDAWEKYRENWVELDAPRHLFIPSRPGMEKLASRTGFVLESITDDSDALQFWGSELYLRDVPLRAERRPAPRQTPFSAAEMENFAAMAKQVNARGRGGRAAFILRATN